MSDPTRGRVNAAFDEEFAATPVPPGLRALSVRAAVAAPRPRAGQPALLALVAVVLAVALIATLVIGSHVLRSTPVPSGSTTPPTARAGASAAYDAAHGVMVLFGGVGPLNDTWTFDGKYWTQHHSTTSPSPRHDGLMAYDEAQHNVVLFGGTGRVGTSGKPGEAPVTDTWTWNGSAWQEKHPAHEPSFGFDRPSTMLFDPITRTVLAYGFTRSTTEDMTNVRAQTWSWNGSDWRQLTPATSPSNQGTMLYDGHRVLLIAVSAGMVGGRYLTQTWEWDGANWNLVNPKVNLPLLGFASGAYDSQRGQLVLLTGDTWTWDGSTWSRQHPTFQPPTVGYMVYMPSLREVVSWGDVSSSLDNEVYAWDGADWKVIAPGISPGLENGGKGYRGVLTPDQAAALVRSTVKNTRPVLLPTFLPNAGYDAAVYAEVDGFSIRYQSDLRDKDITFGIIVPNPPPGGGGSKGIAVRFRNAEPTKATARGYAEYFVYDTTTPTSQRWLMWSEPGTMTNPELAGPGVPYFLSASGLTDSEFWQVANSLR